MARTTTTDSGSLVFERRVATRIHKYHWPAVQLNVWMLVMLAAASLVIGVFATFIYQQEILGLSIPWYVWETRLGAPSILAQDLYMC